MKKIKHQTVTITLEMLRAAGACAAGHADHAHLLPATISTDYEDNIDLAIEMAEVDRRISIDLENDPARVFRLQWLMYHFEVSTADIVLFDRSAWRSHASDRSLDVGLVAQGLALVAEAILSKQERS